MYKEFVVTKEVLFALGLPGIFKQRHQVLSWPLQKLKFCCFWENTVQRTILLSVNQLIFAINFLSILFLPKSPRGVTKENISGWKFAINEQKPKRRVSKAALGTLSRSLHLIHLSSFSSCPKGGQERQKHP